MFSYDVAKYVMIACAFIGTALSIAATATQMLTIDTIIPATDTTNEYQIQSQYSIWAVCVQTGNSFRSKTCTDVIDVCETSRREIENARAWAILSCIENFCLICLTLIALISPEAVEKRKTLEINFGVSVIFNLVACFTIVGLMTANECGNSAKALINQDGANAGPSSIIFGVAIVVASFGGIVDHFKGRRPPSGSIFDNSNDVLITTPALQNLRFGHNSRSSRSSVSANRFSNKYDNV